MSDMQTGPANLEHAVLPAVVATERLSLRLWDAAEAAAVRADQRRPDFHADFPREDDRDAAILWHEGDPWGPRSIVRGVTVLGSVGFFGPPQPTEDGVLETEIGYGLVREAWGWGFATEAVRALTACTDELAVRVRASVSPDNPASIRVLAKTGFTSLRGTDEDGNLVFVRPLA